VPDFIGRRRRPARLPSKLPVGRVIALIVAVAAVVRLLTLPEPARLPPAVAAIPLTVVPNWTGPAPVSLPGRLADGTAYQPWIFITSQDSVGIARTPDNAFWRVLLVGQGGATVTELRRVAATELPQFGAFAVGGDSVVWAETASREGAKQRTTLWRSDWRTGTKAALVTANTGEVGFANHEFDLVVTDSRVSWVAVAGQQTEFRSVALTGGQVSIKRMAGLFELTRAPWAVSLAGGLGTPVTMVNLTTGDQIQVGTSAAELATCNPQWCRMAVLGANNDLVRIDLQRPDGTLRHRIAGSEATPSIDDVAVLDRFVPLNTDRPGEGLPGRPGLSVYDISADRLDLLATGVANVQAYDGMLWWSTGTDDSLFWHALDLRTAS
jgi:hypothetical protein